ncbi:MAG: porin [Flaviaesturariibacter sp.]|nr:porin [Flaviaesturariibacter sp.]
MRNPPTHYYKRSMVKNLLFISLLGCGLSASAQRYLAEYDSTLFIRDTVRPLVKRLENLRFSGYIQPQFQVAQAQGAPSVEGGNFTPFSNNRFMLRRARIKIDYLLPALQPHFPRASFTFQVDATERGVIVRDMFLRLYQEKQNHLSFTIGLFARPFGYEVNLSSGYRESPERSRASQTLMPGERDLGAMLSYEGQHPESKRPFLKFDIGVFNGQGPAGTTDFDSYKDLVSRLSLKPLLLAKPLTMSGGLSLLYGGWRQGSKYIYRQGMTNGKPAFVIDSSLSNIGKPAPRHYYGADIQLAFRHRKSKTEMRGEYWRGKQPGTATGSVTPGVLLLEPLYQRHFDAAVFYLIQTLGSPNWEAVLKLDWYDPNTKAKEGEIGAAGANLTAGDVRFTTIGFGLTHYFGANLKALGYYSLVRNEKTALPAFTTDQRDNVFTLRLQLRF